MKLEQKYDLILCRGVLNDIIDINLRQNIFKVFKSLLKVGGVFIFDVRDWDNSYKQKNLNPITEKTITLDSGELFFKSETRFNKALKQLLIKATHIFKHNNTIDTDEYNFIMQCWTIEELKKNLKNAEFNTIEFYRDYSFDTEIGNTEKIIGVA